MNPAASPTSRSLGKSEMRVSPLGLGCWPMGGVMYFQGRPDHYGPVDDAESIRAVHAAIDAGVTFFDTADCYGAGHSESVLGQALEGRRDAVVLATKFGHRFDPQSRHLLGEDASPDYIATACRASLRRLRVDRIDLYQIHCWALSDPAADDAVAALERLRQEGLIRWFGWSTDELAQVQRVCGAPGFAGLQHESNVFCPGAAAFALCRAQGLASIARSPLAMGLLSGRYTATSRFGADDVRGAGHEWVKFFRGQRPDEAMLRRLAAVRDILTTGGRSLVQGALAYVWGRSDITVPIPGFRTVAQAVELAGAVRFGPLTSDQVAEIDRLVLATN